MRVGRSGRGSAAGHEPVFDQVLWGVSHVGVDVVVDAETGIDAREIRTLLFRQTATVRRCCIAPQR